MRKAIVAAIILVVSVGVAQAGTRADLSGDAVVDFATTMDMPLMNVGNPGNVGELSGEGAGGYGPDVIVGAVDYAYRMGKFEVTAGQYTEFLNAVAATDTYGLYNENMWLNNNGCKIERTGASGSYSYNVAADRADRPVNFLSWGDSARFVNWVTNGMPSGGQDLTMTEDGSYFLNGATTNEELMSVSREADARYVIPSEDEWYKAAYHKNDGVTGNYFDYPTTSDAVPSNDLVDPDPGNNATYYISSGDWTIGMYERTEVGEFELSDSPYGTFDQGGNVCEWNEAVLGPLSRGRRGGSYHAVYSVGSLASASRSNASPSFESGDTGLRVAEVPEPGSASLLLLGALGLVRRRRKV